MLLTTVGSIDDGTKIAKQLLEQRLAACVQLMPIQSFYVWKGAIADDREILLLIKTRTALFEDAISYIKQIHPYEVPEIVGTEFVNGFEGYLSWVKSTTR